MLSSQQIILQEEISLKLNNKINAIYDSYSFEEHILLLADSRKKSDLNTIIIAFDHQGNILQEIEIGSSSFYERPIGIVQLNNEYLLLLNKTNALQRALEIIKLNKDLQVITSIPIDIDGLDEGTAMLYNQTKDKLNIVGSKCDDFGNCYPILYELDANTFIEESALVLNKINDKNWNKGMEVVTMLGTDESGEPFIKGKQEVAQNNPSAKYCNRIICGNENCSALILIGFESSTTITDFWIAKTDNGSLEWEHIYQTKVGGDEAFDVFLNDDETILVAGLEYTKSLKENYQYKSMLLNGSGEILSTELHRKKMRSMYRVAKQIDEDYLIVGTAQKVNYPSTPLGTEYIVESDIYMVLVDYQGKRIKELLFETDGIDIVYNFTILNDSKIMVIYERNEELMTVTFTKI